jgi:hypothetical protein
MMADRTARAALVLAMAAVSLGGTRPLAGAEAPAPATSFEVVVPDGAARLAKAAGLDPATDAWRLLPDLTRRLHASYGERTAARMTAALAAFFPGARLDAPRPSATAVADEDGTAPVLLVPAEPHVPAPPAAPEPAAIPAGRGDRVSIPLSPAAWDRILGRDREGRPRDVLTAIVTDGAAARIYRGLLPLDAPTLDALADGDALRTIYRKHSEAFAAFAASFHVEAGRVRVPGGHGEAALWQDLVGAPVTRPGEFLVQLAAADQGRLFFFYDAIDRLDEPHRRFALAASDPDPRRRAERVRALRSSFMLADPWWDLARLPFSRPVADAPRVLQTVRVGADGLLAPPNRRVLWEAAFDDQVEASPEWRARLAASVPADAAWVVERIATADGNQARSRLAMVAFAQRVFGGAEREADPGPMLAALRLFGRYRALALTLERMGLRDPAVYAAAARHAEQIEEAGHGERGRATLAQFQGALAIVERALAAGSLDADTAERHVFALSGGGPVDDRYHERVADWIEHGLVLPLRNRLGLPDSASAESVVLRAMAGPAENHATRFEWEGLIYDLVPADAEYRRLRALRRRQGGSSLDEALALSGAQRESRLADVLIDLAYAAALGPAESAPAASEDIGRRHVFGFDEPGTLGGPRPEWTLPREVAGPGQRWHVEGALLGLDVGLARLALRRLETDVPPMPLLSAADRRAFAEGAAVLRARALDDEGRDRIAAALQRGRARLRQAARDGAALEQVVADLNLRDWRRGVLPTVARTDPAHFESAFTLGEELWLGSEAPPPPASWGTSARWDDGCLCPRLRRPVPLDELAGRTADGRMAALSPDLHLRVAELMAEMRLPARLAPAILSLALQDLMDESEPAYLDDALSIARYARGLTRTRMEDYVAALVGRGPLSPVAEP